MTRLRIEPNQQISELMLKQNKAIFRVKFRYHLHTFEEVKKDEQRENQTEKTNSDREIDKSE